MTQDDSKSPLAQIEDLCAEFLKEHTDGGFPSLESYVRRFLQQNPADESDTQWSRECVIAELVAEVLYETKSHDPASFLPPPAWLDIEENRLGIEKGVIDATTTLFADEFDSGKQPRIEAHLESIPDEYASTQEDVFTRLLKIEVEHHIRAGSEPSTVSLQQRFPDQVDVIRRTVARASGCHLHVGQTINDHYEITEFIGRGGEGEIYRAKHLKLEIDVAIKIRHRDSDGDSVIEEARRMIRVKDPGMVQVLDADNLDDEHVFIVLELLNRSLRDLITSEGFLPPDQAVKLMLTIANTLHKAHRQMVHRDLKPDNILLTENDEPKIGDWGLAKALSESETEIAGTPKYMSPEQKRGDEVDRRSDIYACGVMLYEMLAGKTPEQLNHKSLLELQQSIPDRLQEICDVCLANDPADRYQTMGSFAEDLDKYAHPPIQESAASNRRTNVYPPCYENIALKREALYQDRKEMSEVRDWWRNHSSGVCALIGPPGSGKSILAGRLRDELIGVAETPGGSLVPPDFIYGFQFQASQSVERCFAKLLEEACSESWLDRNLKDDIKEDVIADGLKKLNHPRFEDHDSSRPKLLVLLDATEFAGLPIGETPEIGASSIVDPLFSSLLVRAVNGEFPDVAWLLTSTGISTKIQYQSQRSYREIVNQESNGQSPEYFEKGKSNKYVPILRRQTSSRAFAQPVERVRTQGKRRSTSRKMRRSCPINHADGKLHSVNSRRRYLQGRFDGVTF